MLPKEAEGQHREQDLQLEGAWRHRVNRASQALAQLTEGRFHPFAAETTASDVLIADKGYDADKRVRVVLARAGKTAVIPPRRNRKSPASSDKEL